ncbi:MAG: hypothetical protein K0Q85_1204 [Caproiciproducens sp.]|nr:hypothetical protein [Caproiciproducens sp.]
MRKKIFKAGIILVASILLILIILNPNRASFNHSVFEGGANNNITENKEIMNSIIETNRKDYNNDSHPFIKRRNYLLYSIYDVQISDTKAYHILGAFQLFKLLD